MLGEIKTKEKRKTLTVQGGRGHAPGKTDLLGPGSSSASTPGSRAAGASGLHLLGVFCRGGGKSRSQPLPPRAPYLSGPHEGTPRQTRTLSPAWGLHVPGGNIRRRLGGNRGHRQPHRYLLGGLLICRLIFPPRLACLFHPYLCPAKQVGQCDIMAVWQER